MSLSLFSRLLPLLLISSAFAADDWPWWRGPNHNGVADSNQSPPLTWSSSQNVLWKADIPGRGHGSPMVFGDRVVVQTADEKAKTQSVLCFHRQTGAKLWETQVHSGGFPKKSNKKASLASSTPACDGERIFVSFLHDGAIRTTALDLDGKQLWQTKISDYIVHQGYGASPAIYQNLVFVAADNKGGGAIAALERTTGKIIWRQPRPKKPNYSSPVVVQANGRDQLILTGCNLVSSFDPLTGKKLWEIDGATTECVTSTVTDGKLVLTSGGYPKNHVSAVRADGSGEAWSNKTRVYVPSMLLHNGYLYAAADAGVAVCWRVSDGKEMWKGRLGGGFTSSPVMVGEHIFAVNEVGQGFVYKASPEKLEIVSKNRLGDQVFATPTICGGRIFMRVAVMEEGKRQERLYCLGK